MHHFSVLLRTCFYPRENNRIWSHTGNLFSAFNSFSPITNLMRLKINIKIFSFYYFLFIYFYLSSNNELMKFSFLLSLKIFYLSIRLSVCLSVYLSIYEYLIKQSACRTFECSHPSILMAHNKSLQKKQNELSSKVPIEENSKSVEL